MDVILAIRVMDIHLNSPSSLFATIIKCFIMVQNENCFFQTKTV